LELGTRIEGLARHASVHAAGVVIAPGPLTDYVPVCLAPQEADAIITQFDMVGLEQVGMLKIDILGLKTLTVIHDVVEMVRKRHDRTLDMQGLDLEDPDVYRLLRSGRTAGVFQFESPLATDCLRNMQCDRFDDLVAANALLRPGRFGFNKSHAVAYSVLSYQTAWLKTHYAPEFMSALLSSEIGNTDKVVQYIAEARELGLEVLPPDVNESGFKFTVVGDARVRFG